MIVTFDTVAKAMYVKLKKGKVAKTIEFAPETFVDVDINGNLLGIEILNPGKLTLKRSRKPTMINKIAVKYHEPELKNIVKEINQYAWV